MASERKKARQIFSTVDVRQQAVVAANTSASVYGLRRSVEWELGHPSGAMGDSEIKSALESGQLVVEPFDPDLLQSSSYDVRLGGNFYVAEQIGHRIDFSPYSREQVEQYYKGPLKAMAHGEWCKEHGRAKFAGIDDDELIIVLRPGECILAHTVEFIGAAYGATTMMKARSSLGRINISSCDDAGWGDVGYINRWTMEVRNKNRDVWVPLVVGMPIAQVVFFHVAESAQSYAEGGHYQSSQNVAGLRDNWTPEQMLPRLWSEKNREIRQYLKGASIVW